MVLPGRFHRAIARGLPDLVEAASEAIVEHRASFARATNRGDCAVRGVELAAHGPPLSLKLDFAFASPTMQPAASAFGWVDFTTTHAMFGSAERTAAWACNFGAFDDRALDRTRIEMAGPRTSDTSTRATKVSQSTSEPRRVGGMWRGMRFLWFRSVSC